MIITKQLLKIAAVIAASVLLFTGIVSADTDAPETAEMSAVYNSQTKTVDIKGTTTQLGSVLAVMVLPSDIDRNTITYQDITDNKYVTRQIMCDKDGSFDFDITMPDAAASGEYTVYAIYDVNELEADFSHVSDSDMLEVISLINSADNAEIVQIIRDNYIKIGISADNAAYAEDLGAYIYTQRPSAGYKLDSFVPELNRSLALSLIKNNADIHSTVKAYADSFGVNYDSEIKGLSKSVTDKMVSEIKTADVKEPTKTIFYKALLFSQVSCATSYVACQAPIETYADETGIDLSDYNSSRVTNTEKTQIMSDLYKANTQSFNAMKDKFEALAAAAASSSGSGNAGGSSGSGGGAASGGMAAFTSGEQAAKTDKSDYTGFFDMENHWSREYVEKLCVKKIISGFEDNSFRPEYNVTRAEYIKLIVSAVGVELTGKSVFDDVSENDWYFMYVSAAADCGLAAGYDGKFRPNDNITREEAAVILYRTLEMKDFEFGGEDSFSDAHMIADYAKEAVGKLSNSGIVSGYNSEFSPKALTKRSEAATMIYKMLSVTGGI